MNTTCSFCNALAASDARRCLSCGARKVGDALWINKEQEVRTDAVFWQGVEPAGAKVLLVEDEPGMQELLTIVLKAAGFAVDVEFDGDLALKRYHDEGPYALVMTDEQHPGMWGSDLIKAIRQLLPGQSIIFFSDAGRGLKGFVDVHALPKPYLIDDFMKTARTALWELARGRR